MNLIKMTQHDFNELTVFLLPTVVQELPDEASEAIGNLRDEVIALVKALDKSQAELTKEREANLQVIKHIESRLADQRRWGNKEIASELVAILNFIKEGNEPNEA